MNWKRLLVALFAALLLLPGIALAQSVVTGAINGTVTDPSGAVIAGATRDVDEHRYRCVADH